MRLDKLLHDGELMSVGRVKPVDSSFSNLQADHQSQHLEKGHVPRTLGRGEVFYQDSDDGRSSENSDCGDFYCCVHDPLLGLDRNLGRTRRHSSAAALFLMRCITRIHPRSPAAIEVPA